jgi:hypothetical protein
MKILQNQGRKSSTLKGGTDSLQNSACFVEREFTCERAVERYRKILNDIIYCAG